MTIRYVEHCPHCGQRKPWLKTATRAINRVVNGVYISRRTYAKCRRCGAHETIEEREREPPE